MKQLKEYIQSFPKNNYISDTDEQNTHWYINAEIQNEEIVDLIGNDAVKSINDKNIDFAQKEFDMLSFGCVICGCDRKHIKTIGIDTLILMLYPKNGRLGKDADSEYYFIKETKTRNNLIITLHNCQNIAIDEIKNRVIQEIYNFARDIRWLSNGEYDENLEEMKDEYETKKYGKPLREFYNEYEPTTMIKNENGEWELIYEKKK